MDLCRSNHPDVSFEGAKCPACAARAEKAKMWNELQIARDREKAAIQQAAKASRELAGVRRELDMARGEITEQAKIIETLQRHPATAEAN